MPPYYFTGPPGRYIQGGWLGKAWFSTCLDLYFIRYNRQPWSGRQTRCIYSLKGTCSVLVGAMSLVSAVLRRGDAGSRPRLEVRGPRLEISMLRQEYRRSRAISERTTNQRSGNPAGYRYSRALHAHPGRRNCISGDREASCRPANQQSIERRCFRCSIFRAASRQGFSL